MSINETCGNCGSSIDIDRNDEVQLWREWQATHNCKTKDDGSFFSQASPVIEQSESKLGFTRSTQFDDDPDDDKKTI